MKRKHAKELLPIITAYANGQEVEHATIIGWVSVSDDAEFNGDPSCYRIKPKPREWVGQVIDRKYTVHGEIIEFTIKAGKGESTIPNLGGTIKAIEVI